MKSGSSVEKGGTANRKNIVGKWKKDHRATEWEGSKSFWVIRIPLEIRERLDLKPHQHQMWLFGDELVTESFGT